MTVRELLVRIGFSADTKKMQQVESNIQGLASSARGAVTAIAAIGGAIAGAIGVHRITEVADEMANLRARVGLVTKDAQEQEQVIASIRDIANETRQGYAETGNLYAKMARNSKQLGASQQDVLDVTETINKALVIGGANTAESNSTILQLSQALASGRLQGDELRSLSENAPMLMEEVAKAYGVTIGQLRQLGAEGQLESKGVFAAILKAKDKMDKQFKEMPVTIGQAMTVAGNKFAEFIEDVEKGTGIFKKMTTGIVRAVKWIDNEIRYIAKRMGGFNNMIKVAAAGMVLFGAAVVAIAWKSIVAGIAAVGKAMAGSALAAPHFWLIAAAVMLVALALDDLYTWINGGDSLMGEWFGSWEEFRNKASTFLAPLIDGVKQVQRAIQTHTIPAIKELWAAGVACFNAFVARLGPAVEWMKQQFNQLTNNGQLCFNVLLTAWNFILDSILSGLTFWRQIFEGDFSGAIGTVIGFLRSLLTVSTDIFSQIGKAISRYVLSKLGRIGQMIARLTGVDLGGVVSTQSIASAGTGGISNVRQDFTFHNQFGAGTTAEHASYVQANLKDTFSGAMDVLAYSPGEG